jgi:hypothetical protein
MGLIRVLHYTLPERLANQKHSILSGLFVSYEENEVLQIRPLDKSINENEKTFNNL